MTIRTIELTGTTDASGDAVITATVPILGRLEAVEWIDGDLANNNTAVLTCNGSPSGVAQTLHTQAAGEGDDDGWYYPRVDVHDLSAAVMHYNDASDEPVAGHAIVNGYLVLTIAAGGATKTGGCVVYIDE